MQRFVFVFAALLAVAAAKAPYPKCPYVAAKYPFDSAKFDGDWNVIAYLPNAKYGDKKCVKVNIASTKGEFGTTINAKLSYFLEGKAKTGEAIGYCKGEDKGAISYIAYKTGDEGFTPVYKQAVIATDYDNYAVAVSCRPTFNSETKEFGRDLHAKIYSRSKTLSADTLKTLKSLLTSYDIEFDSIKMMEHDC